jgi:putative cardiolipin synthase
MVALVLAAVLSGSACTYMPAQSHPESESASSPQIPTSLRDLFSYDLSRHPGQSGFHLLSHGREAMQARVSLVELADESLDLQYYAWHGDLSGMLLLARVVSAADRGVRVRLLIDDLHAGDGGFSLSALDAHPNIDVRLYNPFGGESSIALVRPLTLLGDFSRINNRMHNKIFAADNQLAIVGGRNIGDEYFAFGRNRNFLDLDLIAVGPVVPEISASFDRYWNSDWSVSIRKLVEASPGSVDVDALRSWLQTYADRAEELPYALDANRDDSVERLDRMRPLLSWGDAGVSVDPPRKDLVLSMEAELGVARDLLTHTRLAEHEVLVISPYFIPSTELIGDGAELVDRGVNVRVLTNAIDANDIALAHYVYSRKRRAILKAGVTLYEFRADAAIAAAQTSPTGRPSSLSLHSKVIVFDRKTVFVGSFNVDRRSVLFNTEVGVIVNSPELAERLVTYAETLMGPENSFLVFLAASSPSAQSNDQRMTMKWQTSVDGRMVTYNAEPAKNFWNWLGSIIFIALPVDEQI